MWFASLEPLLWMNVKTISELAVLAMELWELHLEYLREEASRWNAGAQAGREGPELPPSPGLPGEGLIRI